MTSNRIQSIRARLDRRLAPSYGDCERCGHRQEMPSANYVVTSRLAWACMKCGGQIFMTFTLGTDDPSPNEDIQELLAEVERLQAGNFTKEEIHNICHNLHNTVSLEEFAAACKAEQIRLYGKAGT